MLHARSWLADIRVNGFSNDRGETLVLALAAGVQSTSLFSGQVDLGASSRHIQRSIHQMAPRQPPAWWSSASRTERYPIFSVTLKLRVRRSHETSGGQADAPLAVIVVSPLRSSRNIQSLAVKPFAISGAAC